MVFRNTNGSLREVVLNDIEKRWMSGRTQNNEFGNRTLEGTHYQTGMFNGVAYVAANILNNPTRFPGVRDASIRNQLASVDSPSGAGCISLSHNDPMLPEVAPSTPLAAALAITRKPKPGQVLS